MAVRLEPQIGARHRCRRDLGNAIGTWCVTELSALFRRPIVTHRDGGQHLPSHRSTPCLATLYTSPNPLGLSPGLSKAMNDAAQTCASFPARGIVAWSSWIPDATVQLISPTACDSWCAGYLLRLDASTGDWMDLTAGDTCW